MTASGTPVCMSAPPVIVSDDSRIAVVPAGALALRFDGAVDALSITAVTGEGAPIEGTIATASRTGSSEWAVTLDDALPELPTVRFGASYEAGQSLSGTANFSASLRIAAPAIAIVSAERRGARVKANVSAPSKGSLSAYVTVGDRRRSAIVKRSVGRAGRVTLSLRIIGKNPIGRSARLVVRFKPAGSSATSSSATRRVATKLRT
jgi:hypothetical protein